ncbi:MAG: sulfur oxidation c-type cytochrome SoxX [Pikeienuella sp.]
MKMKVFACAAGIAAMAGAALADSTPPGEVQFVDGAVAASLTNIAGDAAAGRNWFADRKLGNCLACHENSDRSDQSFHGEVGPSLDGAGSRWTEAELRGIVTNAKETFEGTIMPAFYRDSGYTRTLKKFDGKTILSAQQVEDVIAYLSTLKED